jgi:hypothetical protein
MRREILYWKEAKFYEYIPFSFFMIYNLGTVCSLKVSEHIMWALSFFYLCSRQMMT